MTLHHHLNRSIIVLLNRTFHLSAHENTLTLALINIYYLYNNISSEQTKSLPQ